MWALFENGEDECGDCGDLPLFNWGRPESYKKKPHDDHDFAFYQGFYERLAEGPDSGRPNDLDAGWNEAYDRGRHSAEGYVRPDRTATSVKHL